MRDYPLDSLWVVILTLGVSSLASGWSWLEGIQGQSDVNIVVAMPGLLTLSVRKPEAKFSVIVSIPSPKPTSTGTAEPLVSTPPSPATGGAPIIASIRHEGNVVVIEWTGIGILQSADELAGPWKDLPDAQSPYREPLSGLGKFYRIKQ